MFSLFGRSNYWHIINDSDRTNYTWYQYNESVINIMNINNMIKKLIDVTKGVSNDNADMCCKSTFRLKM